MCLFDDLRIAHGLRKRQGFRRGWTDALLQQQMGEVVYLDGNKSGVYLIPADGRLVARMPGLSV
jgi:hypothetical protein